MSNINDGGPAFPTPRYERGDTYSLGMTMRDYFAAKALQGFCSGAKNGDNIDEFPELCFMMADAMLEWRKK
jgi:hypothetical protein